MKIFNSIILLLLLAGVTLIGEMFKNQGNNKAINLTNSISNDVNVSNRTNYNFDINYNDMNNSLSISENIVWVNIDSSKIDAIYLNLPSRIKKNKTENLSLSYKINFIKLNGNFAQIKYLNNLDKNFIDSTLVKMFVPNGISFNDSVFIEIDYDIFLPVGNSFSNSYFVNFENWYASISPYFNGKFYSYHTHKFIEPYLEYSDFNLKITIPEGLEIATSGNVDRKKVGDKLEFSGNANGVKRFNWFAFNDLLKFKRKILLNDKEIGMTLFIQESKDAYVERYFNAIEKYLTTLLEYADYPFYNFTLIDIPNVDEIENKAYPNLIALHTDLISPINTQKLEYELAFLITKQYLENNLITNYLEEVWLTNGISAFLAEKLVRKNFGEPYAYFNVADNYPVDGLNFMSYAGIPLIYTISSQRIPEGARFLKSYYTNLKYSDLSIPTYKLPNSIAYKVSSIVKPQISLLTMEKIIGKEIFNNILIEYLKSNLHKNTNGKEFIEFLSKDCSLENKEFFQQLFNSGKVVDYAINYIEKREDNKYDIMVERIESGISPLKLSIYREFDTLQIHWNGKEKFKIFTIDSSQEIISAEIDSEMNNLLDLNFANNSYIVEDQYWGSISYATRVFFWFQNALMLIGGKG